MIYLKAYKLVKAESGEMIPVFFDFKKHFGDRIQWDNEFNEFDIFKPEEWGKYLANKFKMPNGLPLPDYTRAKEQLVYEVYVMGATRWMLEATNRKPGKFYLFPAYKEDGVRRPTATYGKLQKWRVKR
jgi:hypothetical protein